MKPIDIKTSTYIDFDVENNDEDNDVFGDYVRISKYKNVLAKCYTPN